MRKKIVLDCSRDVFSDKQRFFSVYKKLREKYEVIVLCWKNQTNFEKNIYTLPFSITCKLIPPNIRNEISFLINKAHYNTFYKKHIKNCDIYICFRRASSSIKKLKEMNKNMKAFYNLFQTSPSLLDIYYRKKNFFERRVSKFLEKTNEENFIHSDYIMVQSEYLKKVCEAERERERERNQKVLNISNSHSKNFNKNPYVIRKNQKDLKILFVGHDFRRKNLPLLIDSILELKNKNIKLSILGNYRTYYNYGSAYKIYNKYQHLENISFEGGTRPHKYYLSSDLFIFPGLYEGAIRAGFEAMSYGLPIFATEESGTPINKKYFLKGDLKQDIQNKINDVLKNRHILKEMSEENFELSKKFYIEDWANNYVNSIEKHF